jgi:hypothetical protein
MGTAQMSTIKTIRAGKLNLFSVSINTFKRFYPETVYRRTQALFQNFFCFFPHHNLPSTHTIVGEISPNQAIKAFIFFLQIQTASKRQRQYEI